MISGLHCAGRFLRCAIVLQNAFVISPFFFFCHAEVQCASGIPRCCKWTGKHISWRSYLLSIPRVKKRGFCHCSATSQNIRTVHCERGGKIEKTSAQKTYLPKIKAAAPLWDRAFLREGHNTSFLQRHGTSSNSSALLYRARIIPRASLRQSGETCPLWEKVTLWEPQQLHTELWHE